MANRVFHIRVRQFPVWFRASIAFVVLVAFYAFIWSLVKPSYPSILDLSPVKTSAAAPASIDEAARTHREHPARDVTAEPAAH